MTAQVLQMPNLYKDALIEENTRLGDDPKVRFIGYGLKKGRALGTLKHVADEQIVEMPVAENLMIGCAIGMSLKGLYPVVFIERMDFVLNGLDAMVNHLDKAKLLSGGEFSPGVIIRIIVGNKNKPLYTGPTHVQDFTESLRKMVHFPVLCLKELDEVRAFYRLAHQHVKTGYSTILVEYKDLIWNTTNTAITRFLTAQISLNRS